MYTLDNKALYYVAHGRHYVAQSQNAVSAYFTSMQILHFGFAVKICQSFPRYWNCIRTIIRIRISIKSFLVTYTQLCKAKIKKVSRDRLLVLQGSTLCRIYVLIISFLVTVNMVNKIWCSLCDVRFVSLYNKSFYWCKYLLFFVGTKLILIFFK